MRKMVMAIAAVAISSGASAAPTYLKCAIKSADFPDSSPIPVEVTADEENGQVTTLIVKTGL